jgi:hypothetical protein
MKKHPFILLALTVGLGCSQMVRIDSDSNELSLAPKEEKSTVIKAEFEDLLERQEFFLGKYIEVSAPITHFEKIDSSVWYLTLEKNGKKIRCYEDDFLGYVPPDILYLARKAKREGDEVTVRGTLKEQRIELDHLAYKTMTVKTSIPPL